MCMPMKEKVATTDIRQWEGFINFVSVIKKYYQNCSSEINSNIQRLCSMSSEAQHSLKEIGYIIMHLIFPNFHCHKFCTVNLKCKMNRTDVLI